MYTREELQKRIFARNQEEWLDAASRDYQSKEVERGIVLPLEIIPGTQAFAGGVCDENFGFVAGFRRNTDKTDGAHAVEKSYTLM